MTALAPGLPPLPSRFQKLPLDPRGYPVPRFVHQREDGTYDFRVVRTGWPEACRRNKLCWLCGEKLGRLMCFVIGPMCAINRNTSEPPCHSGCAEFSVKACPFLRFPNRKRDEAGLPAEGYKPGGDEFAIDRNPGVACLYTTTSYRPYRAGRSVMIEIGEPVAVTWWAHGRAATRAEIMHSIETGLPSLRGMAEQEGKGAVEFLDHMIERGMKLLPEEINTSDIPEADESFFKTAKLKLPETKR
jgi:hypothetical protein